MTQLVRHVSVILAVGVAGATTLAYWNAPVPRGLLVNLLAITVLAGASIWISRNQEARWPTRIVWMACGGLMLAGIASIAWMPPWVLLAVLGLVGCVCRRRPRRRWALARALGLTALGAVLNVYFLGALAARTPFSADPLVYRGLDLRAHSFLDDVPLHDAWVVDLPGGGEGRGIRDVTGPSSVEPGYVDRVVGGLLVGARLGVGRLLGWDAEAAADPARSYFSRLTPADRARCLGRCGGDRSGAFGMRTLYTFDREMTLEVQNRTVHAFLTLALVPRHDGHQLFVGVYVKPTSWFTPVYMATVDPFRRLVLYPTTLRTMQGRWLTRWGTRPTGRRGPPLQPSHPPPCLASAFSRST